MGNVAKVHSVSEGVLVLFGPPKDHLQPDSGLAYSSVSTAFESLPGTFRDTSFHEKLGLTSAVFLSRSLSSVLSYSQSLETRGPPLLFFEEKTWDFSLSVFCCLPLTVGSAFRAKGQVGNGREKSNMDPLHAL